MKVRDYEEFVKDMAFIPLNTDGDSYSVIGLCGEAGEVAEWVKKSQYRKNPSYTEDLLESELGDVLHYITRLALNHNFTLKGIMENNYRKLCARKASQ